MVARRVVDSPIDQLGLAVDGDALVGVRFLDGAREGRAWATAGSAANDSELAVLDEVERQLGEYFAGKRTRFDLVLRPRGTDFQLAVWEALRGIPFGTTTTYGAVARQLQLPLTASRAVGAANGSNPIPVVVPCHRVVGADGTLTGFGGGLHRKAVLLRLEGVPTERDQLALF